MFAAVVSLMAPFAVFLPNIYRGAATVIVESQDANSTFVKPSVPELETRLVTIQQEILSRARLSDLILRLNLYPRQRVKAPLDAVVERMRKDIHLDLTGTDQSRGRATTIGVKKFASTRWKPMNAPGGNSAPHTLGKVISPPKNSSNAEAIGPRYGM